MECISQKTSKEVIQPATNATLMFGPIIDGTLIPASGLDLLSAGKVNKVEVMAGVCTHEGHMLTPFITPSLLSENYTYEDVKSQLEAYLKLYANVKSVDKTMASLESIYMDTAEKQEPGDKLFEAVVHIIGDQILAIPTYHMVELMSGG